MDDKDLQGIVSTDTKAAPPKERQAARPTKKLTETEKIQDTGFFSVRTLRIIYDFATDILFNALIIIGVLVVLRYVLISPFKVQGHSMESNLHNNQYLLVEKVSYRFDEPKRGDIVVLIPPENTETFFVKRIIGLPGEKIEFNNGQVIIHNDEFPAGKKLDEYYLNEENQDTYLPERETEIIEIEENHYFVMGDNRHSSNDSRQWGTLHETSIEGKVWIKVWPITDSGFIETVDILKLN